MSEEDDNQDSPAEADVAPATSASLSEDQAPEPPQQEEQEEGEAPPESLGDSPADQSVELPVVVMGEAGDEDEAPQRRLLLGRVDPKLVFLPAYLLVIFSGQFAANFALDTREWSMIVVVLAWMQIYVWVWLYRVAWEYQRRLLKYTSWTLGIALSLGLAFFCYDRSQAQVTLVEGVLKEREWVAGIAWAGHLLLVVVVILVAHALYLGRGYREKRA